MDEVLIKLGGRDVNGAQCANHMHELLHRGPGHAADVGQRLGAVEQVAVALEVGDIGEHRQHVVGAIAASHELRH